MKKVIIVIFIISTLYSDSSYELKLFEKVLPSLFQKATINVYGDDKINHLIAQSEYLNETENCEEADILVGKYFEDLDKKCLLKPFFTTYYREFKTNPNTIGAFYWRKGRPQIKFHKKAVEEQNIHLNSALEKYAQ